MTRCLHGIATPAYDTEELLRPTMHCECCLRETGERRFCEVCEPKSVVGVATLIDHALAEFAERLAGSLYASAKESMTSADLCETVLHETASAGNHRQMAYTLNTVASLVREAVKR